MLILTYGTCESRQLIMSQVVTLSYAGIDWDDYLAYAEFAMRQVWAHYDGITYLVLSRDNYQMKPITHRCIIDEKKNFLNKLLSSDFCIYSTIKRNHHIHINTIESI